MCLLLLLLKTRLFIHFLLLFLQLPGDVTRYFRLLLRQRQVLLVLLLLDRRIICPSFSWCGGCGAGASSSPSCSAPLCSSIITCSSSFFLAGCSICCCLWSQIAWKPLQAPSAVRLSPRTFGNPIGHRSLPLSTYVVNRLRNSVAPLSVRSLYDCSISLDHAGPSWHTWDFGCCSLYVG